MSLTPNILTVGDFGYYAVTQHGIAFKSDTPKGHWLSAVDRLCKMYEGTELAKQRTLMLLADALNWGQDAYGEEFAQAIDDTRKHLGLSPKTIANAAWVYKKIDVSRRRDGLTLGHYSVIAALPEEAQETLMDETLRAHLTITDLKTEVASRFPKTKRGATRKTKPKAGNDDAESVVQKLIDSSNFLFEHQPTEKMKGPLEKLYKAYRRKWQTGKKK